VKTAIECLELENVPDPLAGGVAHPVAVIGRPAAAEVGRLDFIFGHIGLGLHRDALRLPAVARLVDGRAAVLDVDTLDLLVLSSFQRL
jgi:hypothetical protein